MVDSLLIQASALEKRIVDLPGSEDRAATALAISDCSRRLIETGCAERGLELISSLHDAEVEVPESCAGEIAIARVWALLVLERVADCQRAVDEMRSTGLLSRIRRSEALLVEVFDAATLWKLNRVEESRLRLLRIREELLAGPDTRTLAACLVNLAATFLKQGQWQEARRAATEAVVSADRVGDKYWKGSALGNLAIAARGMCRWQDCLDALSEAQELFGQIGSPALAAHAVHARALVLFKLGELPEARALAASAAATSAQMDLQTPTAAGHLLCALVDVHTGDFRGATQALATASRFNRLSSGARQRMLGLEFEADAYLEQGRFEEAFPLLESVLAEARALIPRGDVVAEALRRRAECFLLSGKHERALHEINEALEICLELGDRYEEAACYRVLALTSAALGKPRDAKKHFDHGFAMYDDIETPYEWGKLWMAYGDWLGGDHAGDYANLPDAREAYVAAIDHFEGMGAMHKLGEAQARLAALDKRLALRGEDAATRRVKVRPRRRPRPSAELQRRSQWALDTFGVVTRNAFIFEMLENIAAVAKSDLPVLILGESGTGKELIARGVHTLSGRSGAFVPINCGAIPESMIEAELFGHSQGSFTGATASREGLIESADKGTLFLDEIGEMPTSMQSRLLRFLELGEARRVGSNSSFRVRTRVVAATNRDPVRMEKGEEFRSDLYYRLAHAVYTMPPLRERGDDVELLVEHFLEQFNGEFDKRVALAPTAMDRILGHSWPGNIRQLRAVIQKLVVQSAADHVVTPRELPADEVRTPQTFLEEIDDQERRRIKDALERARFVKADAARMLRMSRTTMISKMKKLGIDK